MLYSLCLFQLKEEAKETFSFPAWVFLSSFLPFSFDSLNTHSKSYDSTSTGELAIKLVKQVFRLFLCLLALLLVHSLKGERRRKVLGIDDNKQSQELLFGGGGSIPV